MRIHFFLERTNKITDNITPTTTANATARGTINEERGEPLVGLSLTEGLAVGEGLTEGGGVVGEFVGV